MKKEKIFLMMLLFFISSQLFSQDKYSPGDFGLKLNRCHIDEEKMTPKQRDTIVIEAFNFEDKWFKFVQVCKPLLKSISINFFVILRSNNLLYGYKGYPEGKYIVRAYNIMSANEIQKNEIEINFTGVDISSVIKLDKR